jgi:hypothetical protein
VKHKNPAFSHPRVADIVQHYVDHHMAYLGPFVSAVFFTLIAHSEIDEKRPAVYIKSMNSSIAEIADMAGMSKRKSIDALKVLKDHWIIMRRTGRGRGNMNRYYFLPRETWLHPGQSRGTGGI